MPHVVIETIAAVAGQLQLVRLAAVPEFLRLGGLQRNGRDAALGGIAAQQLAGLYIQLAAGLLQRPRDGVELGERRQRKAVPEQAERGP